MSVNSAGDFPRSRTWGDFKKCFLRDRTKWRRNIQNYLFPSGRKETSRESDKSLLILKGYGFQFLKLQSAFLSLMLWDWSYPPRAGFCLAGRPGGGVIWYTLYSPQWPVFVHTCLDPSVWVDELSGTSLKDEVTGRCHRIPVSAVLGSLESCKAQSCYRLEPSQAHLCSLLIGNYLPVVCVQSYRRRLWYRDL